jgi:hypothetical protein
MAFRQERHVCADGCDDFSRQLRVGLSRANNSPPLHAIHHAMNTSGLSEQQQLESPSAPPANDDLTIAEHLRAWKQSSSDQAEDSYCNDAGEIVTVPGHVVQRFVEEHGALHPGDYRSRHGRDWREDFAALQVTR